MTQRRGERSERERGGATYLGKSLVGLVLVAVLASPGRGQEAEPPLSEGADPGTHFVAYPADDGAVAYTDLREGAPAVELTQEERESGVDSERDREATRESKASVDDAQAWVEAYNGHSVGQSWAGYTSAAVAEARAREAAYAAGTSGLDEAGVTP